MKKGRFSLIFASILLGVGIIWTTLGLLYGLDLLPTGVNEIFNTLILYTSLSLGKYGLVDLGILIIIDSIIIYAFRLRKPFSMFLVVALPLIYLTLGITIRVFMKMDSILILHSLLIDDTKKILLVLLVIIEVLLTLALLPVTSVLDKKWRSKNIRTIKRLEKEGLVKNKEEIKEDRIRIRQEKENRKEAKRLKKQTDKFEDERLNALNKEKKREERKRRKEERKYEKQREKEERKKEREEERTLEERRKEEDKELEKEEIKEKKLSRKEYKNKKREEKKRKRELKEIQEEEENLPEYERGLSNPNAPLEFPQFIQMPKLTKYAEANIPLPQNEEYLVEKEETPQIEEDEVLSLENKEKKVYDIHQTKYSSGGMLEATLELLNKKEEEIDKPSSPIIGFEKEEVRREEIRREPFEYKSEETQYTYPTLQDENVAPSGLSPNHPRYKLFEALKRSPMEQKRAEEEAIKNEERYKKEHVAPSGLSPNHPRYKLFENLQNNNRAENLEEKTVSHFPGKSFEAEYERAPSAYNNTYITESELKQREAKKEEDKIVNIQELNKTPSFIKEEKPSNISERLDSYQETFNNVQEVKQEEKNKEGYIPPKVETKPKYEESSYKEKPVSKVEEMENYTPPVETKNSDSIPQQENELELTAGVGGLSSNNLGYQSIMKRSNRLYQAPPLSLLKDYPDSNSGIDEYTQQVGRQIVETYAQQKINVELINIIKGPTVTMFEFQIEAGTKINRVGAVDNELSYALGGVSVRILAPIPGKKAIGVEVPNKIKSIVGFKDLVYALRASESASKMAVPMILGKDINGSPRVIDVAKMPHMIIAGTTGSGKSVCINAFINTVIYQKGPQDVRLILVDPKVVELSLYNGIPHLLTPVVTDAKKVVKVLNYLVDEMERRYKMLSQYGVRNIIGYNEKIKNEHIAAERMPYIVLIMDEFADLMAVIKNDIDVQISRLAAKARAAGIHLILATQRPAADVITGTIKSNLPARIAFAVSSSMNSRIILDAMGAENLLGKGDMLLSDPSNPNLQRIQGAFLSDDEVDGIVSFAKEHAGEPDYLDEELFNVPDEKEKDSDDEDYEGVSEDSSDDAIYAAAKEIVFERKAASASYLQRRLKLGYNRAARIMDMLEEDGIIGPANGSKPREVLRYE